MRYTVMRSLHLSRLQLPTRLLITWFVLSIDVALVVGAMKYTDRADFSAQGASDYWRGTSGDAPPAEPALLPGEEEIEDRGGAPAPTAPKSRRFLVDTAHPHLFTVPLVLFVMLHLLSLTRLSTAWKVALDAHGFLAFAATFGLPFLIAASGRGAWLFVFAGANLLASFVVVSAILLVETWRGPKPAPALAEEA